MTFATNTTGQITARAITVTAATSTKGYDGTTSSTATPTITGGSLAHGRHGGFHRDLRHARTRARARRSPPAGSVNDGNSGDNYAVTFTTNTTGSVTARAITVTAATSTKTYDGTTTAAATPTITSGSLATGDTAAFTETFDTQERGHRQDAHRHRLGQRRQQRQQLHGDLRPNTTGQITARAITVTAATSTKGYDGTTSSTAAPTITAGSLATGDTAAFTETYDTKNVGTGKTLTAAGSVNDGNGGNNYTVTFAANTTGQITARAITVTAATSTKVYDGTTSSTATPTITAGSLATGDTAAFTETFDTRNAGTGKTLTAAGSVNDGNSGNNYAVTFVTNTTGSITARAITVTAVTSTKVYDGTTSATATPTITGGSLATGDTAAFTETFDTRNVGTGKTLTAAGSVNDGNSGNNYTVSFVTNTTGADHRAGDHGHGGHQHQGLRRHDLRGGHADDHRRQPGHRRHGGLHRDLRHPERGHGQDAHRGRLGQRRQQRQQLRGDLRRQHHGRDQLAAQRRHQRLRLRLHQRRHHALGHSGRDAYAHLHKRRAVPQTAITDTSGSYSFGSLPAGTYQVTETPPGKYLAAVETTGTVGGSADGQTQANGFSGIVLAAGQQGSGYDFTSPGLASSAVSLRLSSARGRPGTGSWSAFTILPWWRWTAAKAPISARRSRGAARSRRSRSSIPARPRSPRRTAEPGLLDRQDRQPPGRFRRNARGEDLGARLQPADQRQLRRRPADALGDRPGKRLRRRVADRPVH